MTAILRSLATAGAVFAIDQIVKLWVVVYLDLARRHALDVWPPFLNLRMGWNTGVNFGLLGSHGDLARWVLVAIALAVCVGMLIWIRRAQGWRWPVFAGLVIGGAVGNAVDRVVYGAVADFLNTSCCGISNPFSFNLADVAIFLGVFGLILLPGREGQESAS